MRLADQETAARTRDIIRGIAERTVERMRPRYSYDKVTALDLVRRRVQVSRGGTAYFGLGSRIPSVGQMVRIAGMRGDRYVDDVMGPTTEQLGIKGLHPFNFDYGDDRNFYGWTAYSSNLTDLTSGWKFADSGRSHAGPAAVRYQQASGTPGATFMFLGGPQRLFGRGGLSNEANPDLANIFDGWPRVRPGQTVSIKYRYAKGGSGHTGGARSYIQFRDAAGVNLGAFSDAYAIPSGTNDWGQGNERTFAALAPAGAAYALVGVGIHGTEAMAGSYYFDSFEIGIGTFGFCELALATGQVIAHNTATAISFALTDEITDHLAMHVNANLTRITIPADVGDVWASASAEIGWSGNATGHRVTRILRNGVDWVRSQAPPAGSNVSVFPVSKEGLVRGGDYFELYAFQDSGANVTARGGGLGGSASTKLSLSYRPFP